MSLFLLPGESVFFNQVNAMHGSYTLTNYPEIWKKVSFKKMPYHTLFGDGTEIPDDYIQVSCQWFSMIAWQKLHFCNIKEAHSITHNALILLRY